MATVVTNAGKKYFMDAGLNKTPQRSLILRLGKNDVTPSKSSVIGDFTEATFTGYAAVTLDPANWTVATVDMGGGIDNIVASHAEVEFTSSAGSQNETIYTAYLACATSNVLVAANRFTSGQILNHIVNVGDKKTVTPTLSITP